MYDTLLTLQASHAVTAGTAALTTNSAGVHLPGGTPRRGLKARVITTALEGTSPTQDYKIQGSADNTTYIDLAHPDAGQQTAAGEVFIPFETSHPYVRLAATTKAECTATYQADIGIARP